MKKTITTNSPEETIELGASLAKNLNEGAFVALVGELGAGKTMFVKGIAKGLGVSDYSYVNSPSFVIIKEYQGDKKLAHFDVYRLDQKHFAETLDYEKYFYGTGVTVVEWADKIQEILPEEYIQINISYGEMDQRNFKFQAIGDKYQDLIGNLG